MLGGTDVKIRDIMTQDVSAAYCDTSIYEVAQMMKNKDIGSVPVCTNNKEIDGVITDRDIVLRVVCDGKDPKKTHCSEIMTTTPVVGSPDMEIKKAVDLMGDYQIRRLPIVENKKLVGYVALGDIAVNNRFDSMAEEALSEISEPSTSIRM